MRDGKETYGLIKDGNVATKDSMIHETSVPLPLNIMDFLFEGWYDEIKDTLEEMKQSLTKPILGSFPDRTDGLG